MENEIVKTCKVHGDLSAHEVKEEKKTLKSGLKSNYLKCKKCYAISQARYVEKNKEKVLLAKKKYRIFYRKSGKSKIVQEKFRVNNLNKFAGYQKKADNKRSELLTDGFIIKHLARSFGIKTGDVPDSLVGLKRSLMLLKAEIRIKENKASEIDLRRKIHAIKKY